MKKNRNNFNLGASTWGEIKDSSFDVAILPWGAMEPHNYHLPYLTDCFLSREVALDCAAKAFEQGVSCMVLPPIYLGSQNPGQWNKPFCVHGRSETQKAILYDIVTSLQGQGFRKLVIVNGHGGNTFKPIIRDLAMEFPDFYIVAVDWWTIVPTQGYFDERIDEHAGEQETSVLLHYLPELVKMELAGDGSVSEGKLSTVAKKIGWMPRHWDEISADTGIGNPKKSTAEKGKRYVAVVVEKITELLVELGKLDS